MKYIIILLLLSGCGVFTFSEGERSGKIVKLSKQGFIFKTWEGCLALTEADSQGCFKFTVQNANIVPDLLEISNKGERVTLPYTQRVMTGSWQGSSPYWVKSYRRNK